MGNDGAGFFFVGVLFGAAAAGAIGLAAHKHDITNIHEAAIVAGAAEYVTDHRGGVEFRFIERDDVEE